MPKHKLVDPRSKLPRCPQVGDRIRLKPESIPAYIDACKAAGYDDFDPYETFVVWREDPLLPGGGRRLFVDRPPYALGGRDVQLAWSSEDERRAMLQLRGWKV